MVDVSSPPPSPRHSPASKRASGSKEDTPGQGDAGVSFQVCSSDVFGTQTGIQNKLPLTLEVYADLNTNNSSAPGLWLSYPNKSEESMSHVQPCNFSCWIQPKVWTHVITWINLLIFWLFKSRTEICQLPRGTHWLMKEASMSTMTHQGQNPASYDLHSKMPQHLLGLILSSLLELQGDLHIFLQR